MFSLIDFLVTKKDEDIRLSAINQFDLRVKKFIFDGDEVSFVFLPWRSTIEDALKYNWFEKKGVVFVYQGPNGVVNPNPFKANELCEKVFEDFEERSFNFFEKRVKVNIVGLSTGTLYAANLANKFYKNVNKCKLIVPGPKLGENIFCSIATRKFWPQKCFECGINSSLEYDKIFKYNVDENLVHLNNVEIFLGMSDLFIPTKNGLKLIDKIKKGHHKFVLHKIWFGHVLTLLFYGIILRYKK